MMATSRSRGIVIIREVQELSLCDTRAVVILAGTDTLTMQGNVGEGMPCRMPSVLVLYSFMDTIMDTVITRGGLSLRNKNGTHCKYYFSCSRFILNLMITWYDINL